jgi:DeoR/GlpR family transcriptional regulator of sugar metabolism
MVKLGHLRQISTLVTDRKPSEEMLEVIQASETKLVITDSEEG